MSMPSYHGASNSNMCNVGGDGLAKLIIVTGLWTGELSNLGLISGRSKIFFFPPEMPRPALETTRLSSIKCVPGRSLR